MKSHSEIGRFPQIQFSAGYNVTLILEVHTSLSVCRAVKRKKSKWTPLNGLTAVEHKI